MRRLTFLPIAALCVLIASSVLVAQSPPLTPFRGLIDHVSVDQWGGVPTSNVEIWHRAISGDGRYVVMQLAKLGPGDRRLQRLQRVRRHLPPGPHDRYDDAHQSIARSAAPATASARWARSARTGATSRSRRVRSNLVPGDTNDHWDVFVRDLDQQRTVRVSVATDGTQGDRDCVLSRRSAPTAGSSRFSRGRRTFAPGVPPYGAPAGVSARSRRRRRRGLRRARHRHDGADQRRAHAVTSPTSPSTARASAADGRYVLFESAATNLSDVGNPNGSNHLYLRDRPTGQTTLIDRAVTGGPSAWGVDYGTSDMTRRRAVHHVLLGLARHRLVRHELAVAGLPLRHGRRSRGDDDREPAAGRHARRWIELLHRRSAPTAGTSCSRPRRRISPRRRRARPDRRCWPCATCWTARFTRVDVLDSGEAFDQADYYYTPVAQRRRHRDRAAVAIATNALDGRYTLGRIARRSSLTAFSACAGVGVVSAGGRQRIDRGEHDRGVRLERGQPRSVDRADGGRRVRRRSAHGAVPRQREPRAASCATDASGSARRSSRSTRTATATRRRRSSRRSSPARR